LVVSNKTIYNVKGKSNVQRKIELVKVLGITMSKSSPEFVVHCPDEYDYHYSSPDKERIAQVVMNTH
jgi:serum/glucocorticoid-regulated kinase 2